MMRLVVFILAKVLIYIFINKRIRKQLLNIHSNH